MADPAEHQPFLSSNSLGHHSHYLFYAPELHHIIYTSLILVLLLPIYRIILKDYYAFLSLGPGGTPSTFRGYIRISFLSLFTLRNPLEPPLLPWKTNPERGYLRHLPDRVGPRPTVAGIAPQRQTNQKAPASLLNAIRQAIHKLTASEPELLKTGVSCFEKNGLSMFFEESALRLLNATCMGEICHVHAIDGSMHLTLHPSDLTLLLHHGWGERHPLAGVPIFGSRLVPAGFAMVYAPLIAVSRTDANGRIVVKSAMELQEDMEEQVRVLMEIVRAAAWWVGGVEVGKGDGAGRGREAIRERV